MTTANKKRSQGPGLLRRLFFSNNSKANNVSVISAPTLVETTNKQVMESVRNNLNAFSLVGSTKSSSPVVDPVLPLTPPPEVDDLVVDHHQTAINNNSHSQSPQIIPKSPTLSNTPDPFSSEENAIAQELYDGVANFVTHTDQAAWLGEPGKERETIRTAYMNIFDFTNQSVLLSFRKLCEKLYMKGESQQLNRILDSFTDRWADCNPHHGFKNVGVIYTLTFSVLLLNTDHHSEESSRKKKMTKSQFTQNTLETIRNFLEHSSDNEDIFYTPPAVLPKSTRSSTPDSDTDKRASVVSLSRRSSLIYSHDNLTFVNSSTASSLPQAEWENLMLGLIKYFYNSIAATPLKLARNKSVPRQSIQYKGNAPDHQLPSAAIDEALRKQSPAGKFTTATGDDSEYVSTTYGSRDSKFESTSSINGVSTKTVVYTKSVGTNFPPVVADTRVNLSHHRAASLHSNSANSSESARPDGCQSLYLHPQTSALSVDQTNGDTAPPTQQSHSHLPGCQNSDLDDYLRPSRNSLSISRDDNSMQTSSASIISNRSNRHVYRRASWIGGSSSINTFSKTPDDNDYQSFISRGNHASSMSLTRTSSNNSHLLGKRRSMISMPTTQRDREGMGFAAALRSTLIREEQAAAAADIMDRYSLAGTFASTIADQSTAAEASFVILDSASTTRRPSTLSKDELALHGAPWVKEGILNLQAVLDTNHSAMLKRYKKMKDWIQVFVVVQKGYLKIFRFDNNIQNSPEKVVGGGNWMDRAVMTDSVSLCHSLAQTASVGAVNGMNSNSNSNHHHFSYKRHSMVSMNGNEGESYQFTLTLPDQKVLVFQCGTQVIAEEYVYACNYWAARVSKEPLIEAVSSVEHGWNHPLEYVKTKREQDPNYKPKIYSGSFDTLCLEDTRIQIREWKPPILSQNRSSADEESQLKSLEEYILTVQDGLAQHSESRGPMISIFQSGHLVSNRAHSNWEKRSRYLLTETVKYEIYVATLKRAVEDRHKLEQEQEKKIEYSDKKGRPFFNRSNYS